MTTLIGPAPPGLTFQDLVGGTRAGKQVSLASLRERHDTTTHQDAATRDQLMRIYLPAGVMRTMALTRHQELLLSYPIQDNRLAAEVTAHQVRGEAPDSSQCSA